MKTFLTAFFQIALVAINTFFISQLNFVAIFIVSFFISLFWAFNVSRVAISTINQKLTYAFGAGCGAVTGLAVITQLF